MGLLSHRKTHRIKMEFAEFKAVQLRAKTFIIRDDSVTYKIGDYLHLEEWDPKARLFTGNRLHREVAYILSWENCEALREGYLILGMNERS